MRTKPLALALSLFTPSKLSLLRSGLPRNHIHFNAAGASPMSQPVLNTLINHLNLEIQVGGYAAASEVASSTSKIYTSLSKLISCSSSELALHDSSTTSFTHAINSIPLTATSTILSCSSTEYASNAISLLKHCKSSGAIPPIFITNKDDGTLDLEKIKEIILDPKNNVAAVTLTHAPTNGGHVNNAQTLGSLLNSLPSSINKPLYLLDACQTIGQVDVNVEEIGCDFLAGTSRKWLRGPRGVGFLYVKSGLSIDEPAWLDLYGAKWISPQNYEVDSTAKRYEFWEGSVANKLAFGAAIDLVLDIGIDNIQSRIQYLSNLTRELITKEIGLINKDTQDGDMPLSGICSFEVSKIGSAPYVVEELKKRNISVSTSGRSSTLLDAEKRDLPEMMVRFSPHYFNTEEEVRKVVSALKDIKKES